MYNKSLIQQKMEYDQQLYAIKNYIKDICETYNVQNAVFGYDFCARKLDELKEGYMDVVRDYMILDEAMRDFTTIDNCLHVYTDENGLTHYTLGKQHCKLSDCVSESKLDIALLKRIDYPINEAGISKSKQQHIMTKYGLFDCKLWTKSADPELLSNLKYIFMVYANNYGRLNEIENLLHWYFDGDTCINEDDPKNNFSIDGMTNAEVLVKIYYMFALDKAMPELKENIIDKAENGDSYYRHNVNVQEFARLFNGKN
ncbi:MAG: hypothetical protein IIZ78_06065 [Clostridiales bacterium]|nr:hypothetical protein [Clostridiales bacterium]